MFAFTIRRGRTAEIELVADQEHVGRLEIVLLDV